MIFELIRAIWSIAAVYFYYTEGQLVKKKKDEERVDCVTSLANISIFLKNIKEASSIAEEADSWKTKVNEKYSIGEKLDEADAEELSEASFKWHAKLKSIAQEFDKEQRTLELIEERIKKVEKGVEPILENIKGYISTVQSATLTFVESSPTERSLEPTLRGLLNRSCMLGGELTLTGYFDQFLLKDFQAMRPKPSIKFISPELTSSKSDKINLDALERLSKMGAKVRFHPMLHARMVLSPTEIIVGSADIKSDCLGGRRYDAGIWSDNPTLVQSGKVFVEKVWNESKPLSQ